MEGPLRTDEPGPIAKAVKSVNQRKHAVGATEASGMSGGRDFARRMLYGLDLELDEIDFYRREISKAAAESIERNVREGKGLAEAIAISVASVWVDGLYTGVLVGREQGAP